MALKTRDDYLNSLKSMRPNIYKFGELICNVTTHPATRRTVESHARAFDAAFNPETSEIFTAQSPFIKEPIHRFNSMMQSLDEMMYNSKFKRMMFRLTGSCTGGLCVGWNAQNVMWNVCKDMDDELGTSYQKRLKKWIVRAQQKRAGGSGRLDRRQGGSQPEDLPAARPGQQCPHQ
jgi:Aromatic ring hydroxylase